MTDQDTTTCALPQAARQPWDAPTLSVMNAEDAELGPTPIRPETLPFGS